MAITLSPSKSSLGIIAKIEGSVPFVSPTETLIEDNPNLFWDDANNRLGIGTSNPDAKLEINGQIKITGGNPGNSRYLRSDANGLATWGDVGWTDLGTDVVLINSGNIVGIGTATPNAKLDVTGTSGTVVGGFASGALHVTNPSTAVNANSVITGHNLNGGNKQLWYLGSTSSSNDNIAFINRQNAALSFNTNNLERLTIDNIGNVGIGTSPSSAKLEIAGQIKITGGTPGVDKILTSDAAGLATWQVPPVNEHVDHTAVTLTAGDGLLGGGDISVNRTFDVAITPEVSVTAAPTDEVLIADASDSFNIKKVTVQSIADLGPGGGGAVIFAQLSSSVDQEPTVTTPTVITYNTQDDIAGLTHSTTVNPGEITIVTAGTYFVLAQPQVGKTSGGAAQTLNMFMQVDRGSGFVDEPNTNIKVSISDNTATDVIVLGISIVLAVGDKLRKMQRITNTTVGLGLKFTAAEVGPPTIPATPSIIFTMFRIGA